MASSAASTARPLWAFQKRGAVGSALTRKLRGAGGRPAAEREDKLGVERAAEGLPLADASAATAARSEWFSAAAFAQTPFSLGASALGAVAGPFQTSAPFVGRGGLDALSAKAFAARVRPPASAAARLLGFGLAAESGDGEAFLKMSWGQRFTREQGALLESGLGGVSALFERVGLWPALSALPREAPVPAKIFEEPAGDRRVHFPCAAREEETAISVPAAVQPAVQRPESAPPLKEEGASESSKGGYFCNKTRSDKRYRKRGFTHRGYWKKQHRLQIKHERLRLAFALQGVDLLKLKTLRWGEVRKGNSWAGRLLDP